MSGVLFYNKCRIKTDVLTNIQLTEAEEKDVNFYDYDGFRLLSYTNAEALALTELPANPAVNENLTFDEWNWGLDDIKTQINNVGGIINVGAIYHTTDNKTHIIYEPTETYSTANIQLTPTVANTVTVDWGDGSTDTWDSALSVLKTHTYTGVTDSSVYDITISCTSGTYTFNTYIAGSESNNKNCTYTDIKLSNSVTRLGNNCFDNCYYLQSITVPYSVTSLGADCFRSCTYLQSLTIPNSVTLSNFYIVSGCYSLKSLTIPNNITNMNGSFGCITIQSITIPESVTVLPSFYQCFSLQSLVIPNGVTSLGDNYFYNCWNLRFVVVSENITSIGIGCFQSCISLKRIYMKPTTPPTLGNTAAIPNNINLVIYVPTGTLSAYQNATNWSTYSSKMVEYDY